MKHTRLLLLLAVSSWAGCQQRAVPPMSVGEPVPREAPGLHNVIRITDRLYSGSGPESEAGFQSLQLLGFRTVISVDGARPDVDRARQYGLRYVHLPIGYDGVPREQALRLARAVRDLPGLVYLHCHHGKHRSPAAAVAVRRCLDGSCSAEDGLAILKDAGTSPHYTGLYAVMHEFQAVSAAELDQVPADFPEVAPVTGFVKLMVDVDAGWEHMKMIRAASWKTPPQHADLDPAHEALLLREAYREAVRLPEMKQRPAEMVRWLVAAEQGAQQLEDILRAGQKSGKVDAPAAELAYQQAAAACTQCHAKYRDVRQRP